MNVGRCLHCLPLSASALSSSTNSHRDVLLKCTRGCDGGVLGDCGGLGRAGGAEHDQERAPQLVVVASPPLEAPPKKAWPKQSLEC